jgi:large subunit ribosomal protein L2
VARAAGQSAILNNREGEYALLKMPSGEIRRVHTLCYATIGTIGNSEHMNVVSGKAGRTRWLGVRPTVRGMTMNPVDHPNGGGEGRSKSGGGRQHLLSPWGHAKGQKTRKLRHQTDRLIVQRRNAKKNG